MYFTKLCCNTCACSFKRVLPFRVALFHVCVAIINYLTVSIECVIKVPLPSPVFGAGVCVGVSDVVDVTTGTDRWSASNRKFPSVITLVQYTTVLIM